MKAVLTSFKDVTDDGGIIELVVWRVPRSVPPSTHDFKYRAAYVLDGKRVIGFDNEIGKGTIATYSVANSRISSRR